MALEKISPNNGIRIRIISFRLIEGNLMSYHRIQMEKGLRIHPGRWKLTGGEGNSPRVKRRAWSESRVRVKRSWVVKQVQSVFKTSSSHSFQSILLSISICPRRNCPLTDPVQGHIEPKKLSFTEIDPGTLDLGRLHSYDYFINAFHCLNFFPSFPFLF